MIVPVPMSASALTRPADAIIRVDQLTREFGTVRALDQMSFAVPPGIIFGFLGANGAGKTTMIRLLLNLLEPSAGHAQVFGLETRQHGNAIREQSGALLEFSGLYERLSAEDNLEFYGRVWHLSSAQRKARIRELLTHFDLWDRRKERVGTWSRGMKQKVAIARVLLHRPKLIFLDEPTAGLDPVAAAALRGDLRTLVQREGVTVFLTTHNLTEAEQICSQVGIIRMGKLLAFGAPAELRASSGGERVEIWGTGLTAAVRTMLSARSDIRAVTEQNDHLHLELRDTHAVAPIVAALVQAGVGIEEVRRGQASLEEAFLTLMEEDK